MEAKMSGPEPARIRTALEIRAAAERFVFGRELTVAERLQNRERRLVDELADVRCRLAALYANAA